MTAFFNLNRLINVFGVKPTFLLPVFTDGEKPYFQEIKHNRISAFSEAILEEFSECEQIQVESSPAYAVSAPAVYAVQLPDGSYVMGDSMRIRTLWAEHSSVLSQYPVFVENTQAFLQETKPLLALPPSTEKRQVIRQVGTDKNLLFTENPLNNHYWPTREQGVLYENREVAIFLRPERRSTTSNIFQFYDWIKGQYGAENGGGVFQYKKKNPYSASKQLGAIDSLLKYTPATYTKWKKQIELTNKTKWVRNLIYAYTPEVEPYLWTYSQVLKLFDPYGDVDARRAILSWGLSIKPPAGKPEDSPDGGNWWWVYLEENADALFDGQSSVFWLEIKKLSDRIHAIVAQEFDTDEVHFRLVNGPVTDTALISFIEGLYKDEKQRLSLLLLDINCEGNPLTDQFSEWLAANEEKCVIHAQPINNQVEVYRWR